MKKDRKNKYRHPVCNWASPNKSDNGNSTRLSEQYKKATLTNTYSNLNLIGRLK